MDTFCWKLVEKILKDWFELHKIWHLPLPNQFLQMYRNRAENMGFWISVVVILTKFSTKMRKSYWTVYKLHELFLRNKKILKNWTDSLSYRLSSELIKVFLLITIKRLDNNWETSSCWYQMKDFPLLITIVRRLHVDYKWKTFPCLNQMKDLLHVDKKLNMSPCW